MRSTLPADRDRAEEALRCLYREGGYRKPEIRWVGSPHALLREHAELAEQRAFPLWRSLGAMVGDTVWTALWEDLEAASARTVWESLRGLATVGERDRGRGFSTPSEGDSLILDEPRSDAVAFWRCRAAEWQGACLSQSYHWSEWISDALPVFAFVHEVLGVRGAESVAPLVTLTESAGMWMAFEGVAVIAERPTVFETDEQARLHCETGPALAWPDGASLYAIHGITTSETVVLHPQMQTFREIVNERNQERRRLMLERLGPERFFAQGHMTRVATDKTGTLWRAALPGDEPLVLLEVENATVEPNGTRKRYLLRVPPEFGVPVGRMRRPPSPREAVAWTFGLSETDYVLAAES